MTSVDKMRRLDALELRSAGYLPHEVWALFLLVTQLETLDFPYA
jgi:hypothetical protein